MDIQEIRETPIWGLFEKGRAYNRMTGVFTDTDRNYRMYNGDQWAGAKLGDVEPVVKNFIKPIVKYKVAVIHSNLYAIHYSSMNHQNPQISKDAERCCKLLNGYAARIWEKDKMDFKNRRVTKAACINDEGVLYVNFDREKMEPVNEIVKKNDIFYGNENSDDIQSQPYILIRKRLPVSEAVELARSEGVSEMDIPYIVGDMDTYEQSGEAAKLELDNMVTIVYKLFRQNGRVYFSAATRYVDIVENVDTGLSLYPVAHFVWEEKEGSARGEGEVRALIPNQIEVNRTEMRRVLTVKTQAYPQKVVNKNKVTGASLRELNRVGGTIVTEDQTVDDVRKIVGTLPPAQMSPDVVKLQEDLINVTRELAGAGDVATGQVNPEDASGRAILAVQQASREPLTENKEAFKNFVEDVARIWLDYVTAYAENGMQLEETVTDPVTGEETVQILTVPQSLLQQLQASVKIDVTPRGVYDRFAQEQTIENMLLNGLFNINRLSELEVYVELLDDDSVAPKLKLKKAVELMRANQQKIAQIQANAQLMQQRAQQFFMGDMQDQATMVSDARMQAQAQQQAAAETAEEVA